MKKFEGAKVKEMKMPIGPSKGYKIIAFYEEDGYEFQDSVKKFSTKEEAETFLNNNYEAIKARYSK